MVPVSGQNDRQNLYVGTKATSTTPASLASAQAVFEVLIQNDPDNTTDVLVGNSTSQVIQIAPAQSLTIPTNNLATVYVKAISGTPTVNYLGRGQ